LFFSFGFVIFLFFCFFVFFFLPRFLQSEYTADVFEDASGGTFVIQVEGRSISSLLFEITDGNSDGSFTINPSTGIIVVSPRGGLDYETTKHYNLSISAMNMVRVYLSGRV
jgi:protocadherin Fat 1/2/3